MSTLTNHRRVKTRRATSRVKIQPAWRPHDDYITLSRVDSETRHTNFGVGLLTAEDFFEVFDPWEPLPLHLCAKLGPIIRRGLEARITDGRFELDGVTYQYFSAGEEWLY